MSLYDTMIKATEERDATMYTDLFHPEYEFVRHQSGTSMNRGQMAEMMKAMMAVSYTHLTLPTICRV